MSVDLFESRFRSELRKVTAFVPNDRRDSRVWKADFPAWRALFSSLCLYGHSTGYRLPSFNEFWRYCEIAYTKRHPESARFVRFFEGDLLPGMRQRVAAWYESGMAETYLYACLVEAIEDHAKIGVVLYDTRADWKLKADLIVIAKTRPILVSAFFGPQSDRPRVESRRDTVERERKKNTMESAHWKNEELRTMPALQITRSETDVQVVNGVRLFSLAAINKLLSTIYQTVGVGDWLFPETRKPAARTGSREFRGR